MNCPRCRSANREGVKFCEECGAPIELECPRCRTKIPPDKKFCGGCGHDLRRQDETKPLAGDQPRSYTPKYMAETILTSRSSIEGERKIVTVLFADVVNSTAMFEKLDPEAVHEIMQGCFRLLMDEIHGYQGTVNQFRGDGVMALFGAPVAYEDHAPRACQAALATQEALVRYRESLMDRYGIDFTMRIGLNSGPVVVASIGDDLRMDYTAQGDTANIAARMESSARPGTILASKSVYWLAREFFEFEPVGEIHVKGKKDPVEAYRLSKGREQPSRGPASRHFTSPLVGRSAEVAAIKGCVYRLLDGQGGILSITGEAGVGKSRLLSEIHRHFSCEKLLWLEGRALSYGQKMSYWPFKEILWQYAGVSEDDSETEAWGKFEDRIFHLFPGDSGEVLPYLASLIGLEVKGSLGEKLRHLDGESMGKQIYLCSRRFFECLAHTQPLVLVFEDLHWADESTFLLIAHLFPLIARVPLLICGVSRPEAGGCAASLCAMAMRDHERRCTDIHLGPLSPAECTDLMNNLLMIENLPSRTRELIIQKADGNPFFLEEIMRTLVDKDAVTRDADGRWKATSQIETITIPDTVQGVVMARIDRLDEEEKQILRTASVIGRSFPYRLLKEVTGSPKGLDVHLDGLTSTELIRQKQKVPELEYIFKHAIVQESTYESVLIKKRHEIHNRVASAIEHLFADRLDEFTSVLAYHYAKAESWEKAQEYLFKAGDQAGRIAADAEALTHYQLAMETYTRVFGDKWDLVQRGMLERKMGEAFYRRGEHKKAADYFQRALTNLSKPLAASKLGVRFAIAREIVVQIAHRLAPGPTPARSREQSQATEEEARVYEAQGLMYVVTDVEKSLLNCLRRLNFSERLGYGRGVVTGAAFVQGTAITLGLKRIGGYYGRMAMAAAEAIGDRGALGYACTAMTLQEVVAGRLQSAKGYFYRAVEDLHESGYWDRRVWGFAMVFGGMWAAGLSGCYEEALKSGRDLIRFGEDAGDPETLCFGLEILGSTQIFLGQLDEAESNLKRAIELAEAIPDHATRIIAGSRLGSCCIRQENFDAAMSSLRRTEAYANEYHMRSYFTSAFLRNGLAEAYLFAVEGSTGSERSTWLKRAKGRCREALKVSAKYFRPLLPEAMRLRGTYEWLRGRKSAAGRWWSLSLTLADSMGTPHCSGLAHLETGRRLGDIHHLREAEAIFAGLGAQLELAGVRSLLECSTRPEDSRSTDVGIFWKRWFAPMKRTLRTR